MFLEFICPMSFFKRLQVTFMRRRRPPADLPFPEPLLNKLADATWGPIWSADGRRVAFGFVDNSEEIPQTTGVVFATEPDFYR